MANKRFPISLRELEVVAIHDVSPRLRRITFGGAQMGSFKSSGYAIPPFASEGPDDHVKMFFPAPDTGVLTLPTQADGHLNWPSDPRPTSREYTPRSFDPSSGTCDFEFVLHGHGIAGNWAASAKIGDTLHFAGPKSSIIIPSADWYLIVGDETALPAIGNWLEMLPSDAKVIAVILHEDTSAQIPLQAPANAAIHWVQHDPAQPQTLRDTVANLTLPDGQGYVWGAGEREAIRRLRTHLIDERSLAKSQVDISAYWHHGVDDAVVAKTYDAFDALADLAGPFALRAAATYDLARHIANGATTVEALAAAANVELIYLRPLIPILIEKSVLAGTPDALSLAPLGLILLEDDHAREHLDYNAAPGRMDLAWFGLVAALKGANAYVGTHGQSYAEDAASERFATNYANEHGHNLEDAAEDAAKQIALPANAHIVDVRGGEGVFLNEILERHPHATGTLIDLPSISDSAIDFATASGKSNRVTVLGQPHDAPLPKGADTYLIGGLLYRLDDEEVVTHLAHVAAAMTADSRLFVLEYGIPEGAQWLLFLQLSFGQLRDHNAIAPLANRAGLAQVRRIGLPDGHVLFEFAVA